MPRAGPVECHDIRYTPTKKTCLDATALCRGGSRSQLCSYKREAPRDKPVASFRLLCKAESTWLAQKVEIDCYLLACEAGLLRRLSGK
jgi:hypothetical protein